MKRNALLLLAAAMLTPVAALADDVPAASMPGVTFGGRAAYYRPKDADEGTMSGGAQIRFHLTSVVAIEGAADYRQSRFGGTVVDVYPVTTSLMLYLAPTIPVSPYILGGVGWYYTHAHGTSGNDHRFGPHAGAGLEAALGRHWTIDASWRYLWAQSLRAPTTANPAGRDFSDEGYAVTAGLNYRF
jgi:opacity protein-like surface antigen